MKRKAESKCPTPLNKFKESKQEVDFERDYSTKSGNVEIVFRNIKQRLITELKNLPKNHAVIGCVAWLTDFDVLRAMKGKSLGIVVQKEEFLRPDKIIASKTSFIDWAEKLRTLYDEATQSRNPPMWLPNFNFPNRKSEIHGYQHADAGDIRCIGYVSTERKEKSTLPLMHHKFLVFLETVVKKKQKTDTDSDDSDDPDAYESKSYRPYKVWTGSFNMSVNASNSLENVVIIDDEKIVQSYCQEWANLYFNSEALDWCDEYFYPNDDFRVHT